MHHVDCKYCKKYKYMPQKTSETAIGANRVSTKNDYPFFLFSVDANTKCKYKLFCICHLILINKLVQHYDLLCGSIQSDPHLTF